MSFDISAAKNGLILLLAGTPGLVAVLDGAPESMPAQATAWVTVGDLVEPVGARASSGRYRLCINLLVTIGFTVLGNEEVAEDNIGDAVSEIVLRVAQNRIGTVSGVTAMLGGTVQTMDLPKAAVGPSDYVIVAGSEVRVYPLAIEITQYANVE